MHSTTLSRLSSADQRPPYRLAPDVLLVPVGDGSARVLDLHGQFFALTPIATQMLRTTLAHGPAVAATRMARRWNVTLERVAADLDLFLCNLLRQGLLIAADAPPCRLGLRQRLAAAALSVLIRALRVVRPTLQGKAAGLLTAAKFSCRWLGWANTVRLWQRVFPRPAQVLEGAAADDARNAVDDAVRRAVAQAALAHACKERGLTAWALARRAGLTPRLIIGISLCPVHGHCWAQLGEILLADDEERCCQYRPVQTYE